MGSEDGGNPNTGSEPRRGVSAPVRSVGVMGTWHLVRVLSVKEFRLRYRQSTLELLWSLVTPVVTMVVYGVILTMVFDADGGGMPYASMVWAGMVVWMPFAAAVGGSAQSIIDSSNLVTKIYFPREVLPLAVVGTSLFDLAIGTAILIPLAAVQVGSISWTALAVVPVLTVLLIWSAAISILVAVLSVFVRDTVHVTRLALQVGFFATPVMYPASFLPEQLRALGLWNPLAVCIEGMRNSLLLGRWPSWGPLGVQAVLGSVLLVAAISYTRSVETRIADLL